ncbi:MOSC domain-containing protein [Thalassotalea sp. M1531]|uniref:MOSC domain-containing protein n=1 Tax=Thalassotalea algicola TaxID=2716224 RepID=A0A7Y0Q7A7_9GAMM|nr:hybrid-cluster NAD(P)-dependent oxidoreductase [Thalassotalea algicola]NMP31682.1 MOSC domain-containing protein [Thalassotalea algicola]
MSSVQLRQISVYPIKSSAGIDISSSWVDNIGLPYDRRFVVCDSNGQFITARTLPKLCLIQANLTPDGLMITAPDMPLLNVKYHQCLDQYQHVSVWGDSILGQRCHESVDNWISQFVGHSCHLLFFGEQSSRQVKNTSTPVAFADGYPLLLISQASLDDLNSKLKHAVSMKQFRPNMVVSGCEPFAEDSWRHIRIGEVEFELTKPCSRCIFTTVDPITAEKHHQQEPLATLKSYRKVEKGDVMFGQNLIPLNKGQIKIGDKITVLDQQTPPTFITSKKKSSTTLDSYPLVCRHIYDETHDVKTFIFTAKNGELPDYLAGQHLPFTLTINGKKVNAVYTLSSSPSRNASFAITVKRVKDGKVSNFLHDHFTVGNEITAKLPAGNFNARTITKEKVLLLSAGSGITPMLSLLKALTDTTAKKAITFLHSARSEKDLIAADEVNALARQHGNCQVNYTLTQQASPQWQDYQGHLSTNMLGNIPNLIEHDVMVCGPEAFREQAKQLLFSLGLPESQFHFESFGKRKNIKEVPVKQLSEKVNILFDSWDKPVQGNCKETILEQGEAAGLILPYSCRGGMCGSCKVKLESGQVNQLASDGLMPSEKEQGYVLACSCIPESDIVITKV